MFLAEELFIRTVSFCREVGVVQVRLFSITHERSVLQVSTADEYKTAYDFWELMYQP